MQRRSFRQNIVRESYDLSADDVVRVVVSVDDVDGRRERRKSNECQQEEDRVESETHRDVIVPVRQAHHRTNNTHTT